MENEMETGNIGFIIRGYYWGYILGLCGDNGE